MQSLMATQMPLNSVPHLSSPFCHILAATTYILVYFIACWSPTKAQLKELYSLATNFLWGGNGEVRKIAKVAYKYCILPKEQGGLGLLDISHIAEKMATKWILRSFTCNDLWYALVHRRCKDFSLKARKCWKDFSAIQILLVKSEFIPKGSPLVKNMWKAWDNYK